MSKIVGVHTSGAPIGTIKAHTGTVAPSGFILTNNVTVGLSGTTYVGAAYFNLYSVLWNMAGLSTTGGDSFVISSSKGASALVDFNAGKTITIDLRGHFLRASGGNGGAVGAKQTDTIQGHNHSNSSSISGTDNRIGPGGSGTPNVTTGGGGFSYSTGSITVNVTGPVNDGTNGIPRTGAETRPMNAATTFIMSYV